MYPQFELFGTPIYSFGIGLSISFVLFFWMLYKLSLKYGINSNFFLNSIFFYFTSMFFFSRLFYIISDWRNSKFVFGGSLFDFFLMRDYNLSIIGGIFGFFVVLFFKIKKFKLKSEKYVDAVVLAFLFAAIIGYIGAFMGGQILGKPTSLSIGITYNSALSKSSYSGPIFPLAFIYSIASFILFTVLYIARVFTKIEGFVGYLGIIIFSAFLLIFEFFNVSVDTFSTYLSLNITQLGAIALIIYASLGLSKIYKKEIEV